ncbi:YtxH domain-containing protein [Odoribacter lunatus]|uniref:YtxH domain-containing protein n=1 Tax=Odoribacter lunatus TaxID=2941335 RepID=UPI00203AAC32|nr:YtxH domain-containing protein [Odoribacter lunatus]
MRNENSNLVPGLLFGALIGACATYLIIKNKSAIKRNLEAAGEKVKHGVHEFAEKAKNKVEEFGYKAKEKAEEYQNKAAGAFNTNKNTEETKSKAY